MIRPQIKPQRQEDPEYKAFVKRRPCLIAKWHRCYGPVDAHHVVPRSLGGSDRTCVPLCRLAHDLANRHEHFESTFPVLLDAEVIRLNEAFDRLPAKRVRKPRAMQPQILVAVKHCGVCQKNHPVKAINLELYGAALKVICKGQAYSVRIKK